MRFLKKLHIAKEDEPSQEKAANEWPFSARIENAYSFVIPPRRRYGIFHGNEGRTGHVLAYTVIFEDSVVLILAHLMNTAVESKSGFLYHSCILFFQGKIANNKDLGIASLPIEVTAREQQRVAVQIVENISDFKLGTVFLKNQNILSVIGIEWVA